MRDARKVGDKNLKTPPSCIIRGGIIILLILPVLLLTLGLRPPLSAAVHGEKEPSVGEEFGFVADAETHGLGLIPAPPAPYKTIEVPPVIAGSLSASVDLSSQIPPVGNQGRQGSCVAWATSYYYKSWWEKQEHTSWDLNDPKYQFSPSFVYNQINGGQDRGSTFPDAFNLLETKGDVDIQEMPYNQYDYTTQPTSAQLEAAKPYTIPNDWGAFWTRWTYGPYNPPNNIDQVKAWLASGKLLVMGIPIYLDFPGYNGNPPSKYYVYNGYSSLAGGHGVCIVGYDDNVNPQGADADHRGGFKMVNSWGSSWNGTNAGFIYLSYDFVKRYVWEAWSMTDDSPDTPVITSLSSYSANIGSTIHIYGDNFGTLRRNARVTFNGVTATSAYFTNQDITVTVPSGATSGPLIVYDWEGTPSNSVYFSVGSSNPQPTVSGVSPSAEKPFRPVTVFGSNFGSTRGSSCVYFGSTPSTSYSYWSNTQITCNVPSMAPGPVQVTVVTGSGTSNGVSFTVIHPNDTYEPNDSFSLAYGPLDAGVHYLSYISYSGDIDYYKVEVPPGCSSMFISMTSIPAGCDYDMRLFNSSQVEVAFTINGGNRDEWIRYESPVPGTYYIKIYPYTTAYSTSDSYDLSLSLELCPVIESISPNHGMEGDEVTIEGYNFGNERGSSSVSFGSIPASEYSYWSDTRIKCRIPTQIAGRILVRVNTSKGISSGVDFFVAVHTYYFAEGYTGTGFHEYLCMMNAQDSSAQIRVVFLFPDGSSQDKDLAVDPHSRVTVNVNYIVGAGRNVSAKVLSDQAIVAERPMYFNYLNRWSGGHDVMGSEHPSTTFYFAEGYTGPGFEEYICVLNPGDNDANLTFRFQTQEAGEKLRTGQVVKAHSRATFKVNDMLGGAYQNSLKLESSQPVIAERPMYFDYVKDGCTHWDGGHCVRGAHYLANTYYFSEGTTRSGFDEWLTIQNPNDYSITVNAYFQLGRQQGEAINKTYMLWPNSRHTLFVPREVGVDKDVSVKLVSEHPFLAERPIYFCFGGERWDGGSCVIGSAISSGKWLFAEGYTGTGFREYLCIQNPNSSDALVRVTYCTDCAQQIDGGYLTIPANSRETILVNCHAGCDLQISAQVDVVSGPNVVVERPMYFNYGGWDGGHAIIGYAY